MNNSDMPAMPIVDEQWIDSVNPTRGTEQHNGLTKREHFAGLALASMDCERFEGSNWASDMADNAGCIADALLAELDKDNDK